MSWCGYCGVSEQHIGEVVLDRRHELGELVDSVDAGPGSDRAASVRGVEAVRPVTVYLAHPYAHREVGTKIQGLLEGAGITVLNPFDRPEQPEIDKLWPELPHSWCEEIVRGDLRNINSADTVVAILVGDKTIGTAMEIYHNTVVNGRTTFSFILDDHYKTHPWVRTLTRPHYTIESLITELLRWPN